MGRFPFEFDLVGFTPVPVYRRISADAAEMRARGLRVSAIARHLGVDHHTVDKALRWFQNG